MSEEKNEITENKNLNNIFCKSFWKYVLVGIIIAIVARPVVIIMLFKKLLLFVCPFLT